MQEPTTTSARLDNKCRVSIPANIRRALGIEPGDTVFLCYEPEKNTVTIKPAENPFKEVGKE